MLNKFMDTKHAMLLATIFDYTFSSIKQVYACINDHRDLCNEENRDVPIDLDIDTLSSLSMPVKSVPSILLQTCALASRIYFRSLTAHHGLENKANAPDMRVIYENLRFLGLRSWAGLPYVYIWLYVSHIPVSLVSTNHCLHSLLVGFSSANSRERPFFAAELLRAATSFGGYHLELFSSTLYRPSLLKHATYDLS
jgi:hypothetical protein